MTFSILCGFEQQKLVCDVLHFTGKKNFTNNKGKDYGWLFEATGKRIVLGK